MSAGDPSRDRDVSEDISARREASKSSVESTATAILAPATPLSPRHRDTRSTTSPRLPFLAVNQQAPVQSSAGIRRTSSRQAVDLVSSQRSVSMSRPGIQRPPTVRSVSTSKAASLPPGRNRARSKSRRDYNASATSEDDDDGGIFSDGTDDVASAINDLPVETKEDDEVAVIDRGEELVRRRMRERKKEKRRLAALAAVQAQSRPKSKAGSARPTSGLANQSTTLGAGSEDEATSEVEDSQTRQLQGSEESSVPEQTPIRPIISRQSTSQTMLHHQAPSTNASYSSQGPSSAPMSPMFEGFPPLVNNENARLPSSQHHDGRRVSYAIDMHRQRAESQYTYDDEPITPSVRQEGPNSETDDDDDRQLHRGGQFGEQSDSDEDEDRHDVEYTLKDRQDAINIEHPFGLPIWKPALYKKSRTVTRNAERELHLAPSSAAERHLLPGNIVWTLFFGTALALICFVLAGLLWLVPFGGSKYGRVLFELGGYLFWPFGRYVEGWDWDTLTSGLEQQTPEKAAASPDLELAGDGLYDDSDGESYDVEAAGRTWSRNSKKSFSSNEDRFDRSHSRTPKASRSTTKENSKHLDDGGTTSRAGETTGLLAFRNPAYGASGSRSASSTVVDSPPARPADPAGPIPPAYDDHFRVRALGRLCYWAVFYLILAPIMLLVCIICWGLVFSVPMAKLNWALVGYLSHEPLALHFRSEPKFHPPADDADARPPPLKAGQLAPKHSAKVYAADRGAGRLTGPRAQVLLCTYKAFGLQYYKYTFDGVNIMFINLLPLVFFVIFDFFFIYPRVHNGTGLIGFISAQSTMFVLALLSVIPLSYFIGMAVASISAQSSIGMGAVINATFGSIIEVILYGIALTQGKATLVEGSIVGSLLAGVLLMPGLSMVSGAIRRKEQRFNAKSAGVTSTMLIMAIIGILTPTLFYEIYGTFQLSCEGCPPGAPGEAWRCTRCTYEHVDPVDDPFYLGTVQYLSYTCAVLLVLSYLIGLWFSLRTHASQIWQNQQGHIPATMPHSAITQAGSARTTGTKSRPALEILGKLSQNSSKVKDNSLQVERPASVASTITAHPHDSSNGAYHLPSGMTAEEFHRAVDIVAATASAFQSQRPGTTLRRQFSRMSYVQEPSSLPGVEATPVEEGHGGHDAPTWSRTKSASVLCGCTVLYAIIAEILVDVVDVVLDGSGIPEKFLGITLFALVPNTTEFMNAVAFAMNGNIALSMEIGSAYALQVCLLQVPAMIVFTAIYALSRESMLHHAFTLVFPRWDVIAILFSVFLLTYVYLEARANYYRGSILVAAYAVLIAGFYFAPHGVDTEDNPGFTSFSTSVLPLSTHASAILSSVWRA